MTDKPFKPYIINAFYTWALEDKKTPYIKVAKNSENIIPKHLENNLFIILRLHNDSVYNLVFSADKLYFLAYFNDEPFQVCIPYSNIKSIFCKETNYGLNFDSDENIYEQKATSPLDEYLSIEGHSKRGSFKVIKGGKED